MVKNPPAMQEMQEMWVQSLGREDSLEKGMATHVSILASRSLAKYSPWGRKESDTSGATEYNPISLHTNLTFHHIHSFAPTNFSSFGAFREKPRVS